jgi:glycosyltransferase involved in cell wall biosynthesis
MVAASLAAGAFGVFSWVLALGWLGRAIIALRELPRLPDLNRIDPESLPAISRVEGPHLTVIVPALNEEVSIETALRSLLASTGLRLQIIAVNDRSTDRTGERMEAVAAEAAATGNPHRLQILHVRDLPSGWLGKPHAMALAAQRAEAPWLLFTDGDVIFNPRALELALRYALESSADHLILVPTLILRTTVERAVLAAMQCLALWTVRLWTVADPKARDSFGVGGFNLVRKDAYRGVGGFEALRMEVLEDMEFGRRIKQFCFAQRVALGVGLVRVRWIDGALSVPHLLEKNGFAIFRYRVGLTLLACFALLLDIVVPLAAMAAGGWLLPSGLLFYAAVAMLYSAQRRVTPVPIWTAILFAPATALLVFAFLRSMILALFRNAVEWRGIRYPLSEIRRSARGTTGFCP